MTEHYFSANPRVKSEVREVKAKLLGMPFTFKTDAGVFSKKGVDFGSRLLIETVTIEPGSSVLDLGCGYGVIGIAIAKAIPNVRVVLADVNERAVELARENARVNQAEANTDLFVSDGFSAIKQFQFNHILFNPPIRAGKATIYRLFAEAKTQLAAGGSLWIVIRKQQGAASAKKELEQHFGDVQAVAQKKGYWIICGTDR
ncbi:class I SAM-dependent methyltransferase [Thermoactinomyces sp. CICC 10521]|uniref:class I SAM-dependent methyltransferase n=1 Tax=Thermoactinomyces sp. CICC 10521 TaxID=2767426 RepID=UPI0018DE82CF|nr:class I SAM-dependent methyltransferase [Thermoactinomyces sp. CICC 10521]MBH8607342.1 class I SAM-dependent methyltransferase [Thermoactinomyces sp. CICC 10521]